MPLSKAVRNKIKQTRLNFSPLPSSSPAKDKYSPAVQDRLVSVRYDGPSKQRFSPGSLREPEMRAEHLPTPEPSSQPQPQEQDAVSSPLSDPPTSPTVSAPRSQLAELSEEDDDLPLPSSKRRKTRQSAGTPPLEYSSPTRRSTRLRGRSSAGASKTFSSPQSSQSFEVAGPLNRLSDLGSPESSGDEDVIITKPIVARRQPKKPVENDFVVDDDNIEYISSDLEPVHKRSKPKAIQRDDFVDDDDVVEFINSDEEEVQMTAQSRKDSLKQSNPKTPRRRRRRKMEEMEELNEELQDLQDSDTPKTKSRTRGGPVTTERDKTKRHFELLRRRRAGEKIPRVEDSDDEEDKEPDAVDLDLIGHPAKPFGLSDGASADSSIVTDSEAAGHEVEEEEEEDDFIEDDSHSRAGRLPHPDIPLEFTSHASARPRELFQHIIEWLVKNKIAPAFSRHDGLFNLAFDRIYDQVKAQAGSRLISSSWSDAFKWSVLARPNMTVTYLPFDEDNPQTCDACNRTNHPATYDFVFSGQAYDKDSLEPIEDDEDEEDMTDDENDAASKDDQGHILAPQQRHFYLGRFCAANAEMGHKLTHWKFSLNQNLLAYLEEQGVLSAKAIVARDKKNNKKREKEAEAIVDSMEATGMIDSMWRDFKSDLDDARIGMEGFERKGGRGKARVGTVENAQAFVWG